MANYITISRILLIFPILGLVSTEPSLYNWIALFLFVLAGITDHLDGYVARKTGSTTSLGALLDLVADKLLIVLTLSYLISSSNSILIIIPSLIIIFREIVISSMIQILTESHGSNPVKVSFIAKSKTTLNNLSISIIVMTL